MTEGEVGAVRLRHETWRREENGDLLSLLMVEAGGDCLCVGVRFDARDRRWEHGLVLFPAGAIRSGREDAIACVPFEEARHGLFKALGLLDWGSGTGVLPAMVVRFATPRLLGDASARSAHDWTLWQAAKDRAENTDDPVFRRGMDWGYPDGTPDAMAFDSVASVVPRRGAVCPSPKARVTAIEGLVQRPARGGVAPCSDEALLRLGRVLEDWAAPLRRHVVPAPYLGNAIWSNRSLAHFTAPGPEGVYRRQAAALYPGLVPMFAHIPELSLLIDRGRPYEEATVARITEWVGPGWTLAKLRRLRRVPFVNRVSRAEQTLALGARLPLDAMGFVTWTGDIARALAFTDRKAVEDWCTVLGLDLATVVRKLPANAAPNGTSDLEDARDMAWRCAETLVRAMTGKTRGKGVLRIAARLLFAGRNLSRIHASSRLWHKRIAAFDKLMPIGVDRVSWPALFQPVVIGPVRITCLTVPSELRREGMASADEDGFDGLAHCSGGYAKKCHAGRTHVASVRLLDGRRLSTIEIELNAQGRVDLVQHRGGGNGTPPPEACDAVEALLDGLGTGSVRIERDAEEYEQHFAFDDGVDWTLPETREAVWAAWRPYVDRTTARLDVPGIQAFLAGLEA